MTIPIKSIAGIFLFIGAALSFAGIIVSEALYPDYHITQVISDLGVGSTAQIFTTSIVIFGVLLIAAAYVLSKEGIDFWFCALMAIVGFGQIGVGFFPETTGTPHFIFAGTVFIFGGILAILSFRVFRGPWAYISLTLGIITIIAIILLEAQLYFGLGKGGMERLIAYPLLFWTFGSGAILMMPEK